MLPSTENANRIGHSDTHSFAQRKANQFSPFLKSLFEAMEYAQDLSCSPWEFALLIEQANALDICSNDLRWLIKKGWIEHRCDTRTTSQETIHDRFKPESQFIISPIGIEMFQDNKQGFRRIDLTVFTSNTHLQNDLASWKPNWDTERRELSVHGKVVKRFRWPAPNQETVLTVFSEEDWPARIEDPLSQGDGLDPKRRLGDTIKCLNRNQQENLIRFRGDGTGEGVLWDFIDQTFTTC